MSAPLAVTFRVLHRAYLFYVVQRQSTADGAWHECDRGYGAAAMNAKAQGYADAFAARHGCTVKVIPALVIPDRPRRTHIREPHPDDGLRLRGEGFATYVGRL